MACKHRYQITPILESHPQLDTSPTTDVWIWAYNTEYLHHNCVRRYSDTTLVPRTLLAPDTEEREKARSLSPYGRESLEKDRKSGTPCFLTKLSG
eukprot:sb/3479295/